ncbi:MAG TPA: hypothetical protein VHM70_32970 [Polyangiaceae bacterium]|jgi:hypothetical protein|nr:hypothetical protein [Polyangiaceae bacterium]
MFGTSKRWAVVALVGLSFGCGDAAPTQDDRIEGFAEYWADGAELCAHYAKCMTQQESDCLEAWPTEKETAAAVKQEGLDSQELATCEKAARSLDRCTLESDCDSTDTCQANLKNYESRCGGVNAALENYLNEHRAAPFSGPFEGTYEGSESGTFSGVLKKDGALELTVDSPSLGTSNGTGKVKFRGDTTFTIEGEGDNGSLSLEFTGTLSGAGSEFSGSGTWNASTGGDGTWTLVAP